MEWVFAREWTPEPLVTVLVIYLTNINTNNENLYFASACIDEDDTWHLDNDVIEDENWDKNIEVFAWTIIPTQNNSLSKMRTTYKEFRKSEEQRKKAIN